LTTIGTDVPTSWPLAVPESEIAFAHTAENVPDRVFPVCCKIDHWKLLQLFGSVGKLVPLVPPEPDVQTPKSDPTPADAPFATELGEVEVLECL
jgi:hypothetical protein